MAKADFLNQYSALAQQVGRATGIDPRIVLAQAALETGYGKSAPNFNFFGIKGAGSTQRTKEFVDGKMVSMPQNFRAYENAQQSFNDYAKLMSGSRYKGVRSGKTLQDQIKALQASGYATDPNYGAKIMQIAQGINLEGLPMAQQPTQQAQPNAQGFLGGLLGGQGIGGALGLSEDMRDKLRMGILAGSDPRAFAAQIQAAQQSIAARRQDRQKQAGRNATADYLDSIGQGELAKLLRAGGINASTAFSAIPKAVKDTALIQQAKAAGLKEGTPEFQQYILSGGDIYSRESALLSNLPTPEKGKMYEFDYDDSGNISNIRLVALEGSEAQIKAAQRQEKIAKTRSMEQRGQSVVSKSVQEALNILDTDSGIIPVAGTYGKFAADYLPDQEARNLKRTLEALQANTAFTRLQEMRDASQTGGALGNVSNVELGLLMSAYGSISQDLDPKLLRKNLKEIERIMGKIENDPIASAFYNEGVDLRGSDLDAQVKSGASSGGAKRLRFDAQGNIIND